MAKGKRQRAEGSKGKDWLVKVSVFGESQESPWRLLYLMIRKRDRSGVSANSEIPQPPENKKRSIL